MAAHAIFPAGYVFEFVALTDPAPGPPDPPPTTDVVEPIVWKIEVGVPPNSSNAPSAFQLDTDPLDNASYPLSGPFTYIEITDDVQSVDIVRGSRGGFDRTEAGTATVVVRNDRADHGTEGDYSVFSWTSPFFPYLGPRARLRISADGKALFVGDMTALPITDVRDNVYYTTFQAVDFMASLNKTIKFRPTKVENVQNRMWRVLERGGLFERGESAFVFSGVNTYQAGTMQEGSALDMAADLAFSEGGNVYAATASVNYISRDHMEGVTPAHTWSDDAADVYCYSGMTRNSTWDRLYTTVTIKGLADDDQAMSAYSEGATNLYGDLRVEYTLPIATALGRQVRANQILSDCDSPQVSVESITIPTARYASTTRVDRIYQELGHVIAVKRSAPGDLAFTMYCVITGIEHHSSDGGRNCETVFYLRQQFAS